MNNSFGTSRSDTKGEKGKLFPCSPVIPLYAKTQLHAGTLPMAKACPGLGRKEKVSPIVGSNLRLTLSSPYLAPRDSIVSVT